MRNHRMVLDFNHIISPYNLQYTLHIIIGIMHIIPRYTYRTSFQPIICCYMPLHYALFALSEYMHYAHYSPHYTYRSSHETFVLLSWLCPCMAMMVFVTKLYWSAQIQIFCRGERVGMAAADDPSVYQVSERSTRYQIKDLWSVTPTTV